MFNLGSTQYNLSIFLISTLYCYSKCLLDANANANANAYVFTFGQNMKFGAIITIPIISRKLILAVAIISLRAREKEAAGVVSSHKSQM